MLLGVILILVVLIGYLVIRSRLKSARPSGPAAERVPDQAGDGEDGALSILRARYARGGIEVDGYEQRLAPLLRDHSTPGHR